MSATIRVFKQLFGALCRVQQGAWINRERAWNIPAQTHDVLSYLMGHNWIPIMEEEIESLFSNYKSVQVRLSDHNWVLYLPPVEEEPDFLPVLTLECRLDDQKDVMKLRLLLVHCDMSKGKPHSIGFRIEPGHNIHGFYHAQLIKNLEGAAKVENPLVECPLRFPETQPCLPLKAKDSVTLVLCLLISLYGIKYCWKFIIDHQLSELTSYLEYFGKPT